MFPHDKTNEWIAQELIRIKENQEPRQCPDYEALIEHIEELSRAELMLGRAFNALWHYCWDPSSAPHHPTPIRVLLGLEHIFSLEEEQQPSVQMQLSTLLTIPIPTSSPWLAAWQVIHQWLHSLCTPHTDWQPLLSVGLHAYHSASERIMPQAYSAQGHSAQGHSAQGHSAQGHKLQECYGLIKDKKLKV